MELYHAFAAYFLFVISTTAYPLCRYGFHLLLSKSSMIYLYCLLIEMTVACLFLLIYFRVTPLSLKEKFRDQKLVQWPILNYSHAYHFCKTTPGTELFSIGHCTWPQIYSTRFQASFANFCQCNSLKTVAKLFSQ